MKKQCKLVQGNAAIAQGAFYAGARYYAGYPITPSSEIAEIASRELPRLGGVFMQMEDELASMGAIVGASLTGAKAFTATSGPGFSLMQENLGMATVGEVPVVVVNGLIVGWVLNVAYGAPLLLSMCTVALGQAVVCYVLGLPLLHLFRKRIPEKYYK